MRKRRRCRYAVHQSVRLHQTNTSQLQTDHLGTWTVIVALRVETTEVRVFLFLFYLLLSVPSHPVGHAFLSSSWHVLVNVEPALRADHGKCHMA